ncbi:MAG: hypothetical protein PH343_06285 [Nitrospira sp.]|nr:hypothetical protein [Nitrospira sp.]
MGMFDTIYFDQKYPCPLCGKGIGDIQTKEFENLLNIYLVKDCISHAEDIRIIKDELFCNACSKHTGKYVYIVVVRGILIGITESFNTAKELINDLNMEKLILWYHDLYKKYMGEQNDKKGSGLFKEIRNRTDKPGMEGTKPFEDVVKQLSEEDIKEIEINIQ